MSVPLVRSNGSWRSFFLFSPKNTKTKEERHDRPAAEGRAARPSDEKQKNNDRPPRTASRSFFLFSKENGFLVPRGGNGGFFCLFFFHKVQSKSGHSDRSIDGSDRQLPVRVKVDWLGQCETGSVNFFLRKNFQPMAQPADEIKRDANNKKKQIATFETRNGTHEQQQRRRRKLGKKKTRYSRSETRAFRGACPETKQKKVGVGVGGGREIKKKKCI